MSSFNSPLTSSVLAVGRSSPNERPLLLFTSTAVASVEYAGTHTNATAGSPMTLVSSSQLLSTQPPERPRQAQPSVQLSEKQDPDVDDDIAVAAEQTQRIELLALIARLRKLLMPATERLLRLRGVLKALQEQLVVVTPAAAVVAATSGISAGASISSVSMPEATAPLRLCVTGVSESDMEEVFHFIVHRDPPQMRCGTRPGVAGSASGGRSPAFSSHTGRGGRPSTPDTGLLVSPHASPSGVAPRRWSRHELGASTAGANVMTSGATTGASASGLWQSGAIGFGGDGHEATATPPSLRFPSTPPVTQMFMGATNAVVHNCPSPRGASHLHSPLITDSPLPDQFPLPLEHLRIASGVHLGGMRTSRDKEAIPLHPLPTTPPPLPATVPMATATTAMLSATSSGAAVMCAGNTGDVGRLPVTDTAHSLQHCTLSPHPPPLNATLGGPQMTTSPPPLPAAPANHNVRRVRSATSLESRTVGGSAAAVLARNVEAPSYESPPPVEVAREEGHESARTPSMRLSSTMPDLPATPPPPLPGFSKLTTLEVSRAPSCNQSPQPDTSPVTSLPSPTHQNIGVPALLSHTAGTSNGADVAGCWCRTGNGQALARASPSPASDFPASLTPIMINSLHCTSSQCSEVSEQPHHYHRSLPGSSLPPITARFTTLPAPFFSRARTRQRGSGGRSFREDSVILSHASSFTPPTMRLVQRTRRRMAVLGQTQLRLSAWDLFHPDQASSLHQAPLPTTASAPGVTSSAVLRNSAEQGSRQAKNGLGSCVSSSGSRLSNSRCQEHPPPLHGTHTVSETPSQAPLGPHWLVSVNEDGILRYEPLPSAAQPPPYMHSPPVATTADFAFLCVPYEALARGMGSEASHGGATSTSDLLGASTGGVGVSVSGDGEAEEVAAVLDVFFGLFSGTKHPQSQAKRHQPQPHNATTEAPSILMTVNKGGGSMLSTSPLLSESSPTRDGEVPVLLPLPLPMLCAGNDGGQGIPQDKRHALDIFTSQQHEAATSVVDTVGGGSRQDETSPCEINAMEASAPRARAYTTATPAAAGFLSSNSTQLHSTGSPGKEVALSPHRLATVPGLPACLTDEWLLPLRQALVDRTIFLLVKSSNEEVPTPSRRRAHPSSSAEYADGAVDERVVQRFLSFAKTHYGVEVQPWRVIIFSYRDAKRARNMMLAVYAQSLRQLQRQQHRQCTSPQADAETLSQTHRTSATSEDDGLCNAASACDVDVLASSTISPAPRSGAHHCSLSPLESLYAAPGVPVVVTPGWAQTPPGASLTSTSRLTLTSLNGGSEYRRGRSDGAIRRHDIEDDKREFADPVYAFLTQELNVPTLSMTLEQYKPLLGCRTGPRVYVHYAGAGEAAPGAVSAAGTRFQVSFAGGTGAVMSAADEDGQSPTGASRRFSAAVSPTSAIEGTASTNLSDDSVDAEAAAACLHAQEVVWRCSGAAGVSSAIGYFQQAAVTHRMARAAFPVMAWAWQLSALLPAVIKDAQSRCTRLRHSGRHTQHKLQGVLRSLQFHVAASPAQSVAALETRVQEGFKDLMQRFLRDLRRLLVLSGSAATAAASSSATTASSSSWPAVDLSAYERRQLRQPPLVPLDALLVYDSPGLREAHQRLARAVFHFHAFYLAGEFAFAAQISRRPSHTSQRNTREGTSSRQPRPVSVYEQRYAALREAMSFAQLQLSTPPRIFNDLTATPPGKSCTRPGTPAFAPLRPPTWANASATATSRPSVLRAVSSDGAALASMTATAEAEEAPMPKVDFGPDFRHRCSSRIASAAGLTGSPMEKSAPLPPLACSESVTTPNSASVGGGSDEQPLRQLLSASSSFTSAGRKGAAAVCSRSSSAVPTTASNRKHSVRGAPGQGPVKRRIYPERAADERADVGGAAQLSREELQQRRLVMERQLIAHVSQINTEILNFLLATCVAAVPHLQRDCVGAELERVKDSQAEIVSTFTTSVRGRKDAAIAMSNLYACLEEWSADMSHLVSVVRSRSYLEKFMTQLRAVLCEDQVRALAVFRCGSGDRKESEDAGWQTPQTAGTPLSSPGVATVTHCGSSAAATRLPLMGGTAMTSGRHDSQDSTPERSTEQHAATPPSPSGAPRTFASKSLTAEVGHRSARLLRYYTGLVSQQHDPSLTGDFSETGPDATSQRSTVLGDVLASPSPSRSLRSLQGGTSTLTSPCRGSRVKGGGGGRATLGLSVSLSSMSAAWSREEERAPVEGGARGQHPYGFSNAATAPSAFFAAPMRPPMAAVSAEALAVLRATTQEEPLPRPQRSAASLAVASSEAVAAAPSGDTSLLATPESGVGVAALADSKRAAIPADGTVLDRLEGPVNASAAAAAAHHCVNGCSGVWQRQLTQWRSALTEVERPADDASAAPLLWILLDTWDETLLRVPYGLLLELDTAAYAESLNRMCGELIDTQQSWKNRCEDSMARIERELKALEGELAQLCENTGEARAEYVRELRAVFDAAFAVVASRDDAFHQRLFAH
ncbi:hypothetical protein GH5_06535 [Leishmania sp. Ghana 2012 LV757]|uniref:hypothetical protein n=1 Tax=Leishmania sp. Ghana 2012 LV757 TaxID=2803181 RepID=UPI001B4F71C7|nr:hypothetical protein GH5_06535 [Leishmania sp. Ghana 2012 LV757]